MWGVVVVVGLLEKTKLDSGLSLVKYIGKITGICQVFYVSLVNFGA